MTDWSFAFKKRFGEFELDLECEGEHRRVAIIGPNGAGKTTFLRILAGIYRPEVGSIQIGECRFFGPDIDLPPEKRRVAYLPQGFALFPHMSVLENVAFAISDHDRREERSIAILETLQCEDLAERLPRHLSGGEKQRVAIARAIAIEPRLFLLDEPFSSLDVSARREMRVFVDRQLEASHAPAFFVTHDVRDVDALASFIFVLQDGRLVRTGTTDSLRADPRTEFVAEFFGL